MKKASLFPLTRRAFLGGVGSLPFLSRPRARAATNLIRLLVVGPDDIASNAAATGSGLLNPAAARGSVGKQPILVVGERLPKLAQVSAPIALVSPAALLALPAKQLCAALKGSGPVRIGAAYPMGRERPDDNQLLLRFGELLSKPDTPRFAVLMRNAWLANQRFDPEQAVTTLRGRLGANRSTTSIIIVGAACPSPAGHAFLYLPDREQPFCSADVRRLARRAFADAAPLSG